MNRDILENLLQERLSDMSVNPPEGMWEKLESGLAAAGAIGAGVGAGAAAADGAASGVSTAAGQGGASAATASTTTATTSAVGGGGLSGAAIGGIAVGVAATVAVVGVSLYDRESDVPGDVIPPAIVELMEESTPIELEEIEVEIEPGRYLAVSVPAAVQMSGLAEESMPDEKPLTEHAEVVAKQSSAPFKVIPSSTVRSSRLASLNPVKRKPLSVSVFAANTGLEFGGDQKSGVGQQFSVTQIMEGPNGTLGIQDYQVPISEIKHHLPLSFGINVDFRITDRLWVSSGAYYTYMKSDARNSINGIEYDFDQKLHYIGVPLWLKYDLLDKDNYRLYAGAGATFEKLVDSKQTLSVNYPASVYGMKKIDRGLSNRGLQASVGLNLGAQWNISRMVGLYFEPGINYYIKNRHQPESYRTENPFTVNLRAGLSLRLNN